MVASIVLTGKYTIGINGNNKIKVKDKLLATSDIPFIRYRFDSYGEDELEFIKANKKRFTEPVHLAEVILGDNTKTELDALDNIEQLAKFLYVPISDADVATGLSDETVARLENITECYYDRIMLKDNTSMLYPLAAEKLKLDIKNITGFRPGDMGICGSPLSFRNGDEVGQACLTAVWARKIMADYSDNDAIVVPSASHENMSCCGCIQYFVVDTDLPAPLSSKEKSAAKKEKVENGDSKDSKESKVAEKKVSKPKAKMVWADYL